MIARRVHYGYTRADLLPISLVSMVLMIMSLILVTGALVTFAVIFYLCVIAWSALRAWMLTDGGRNNATE